MNKFTAVIMTKNPHYKKTIPGVDVLIHHEPNIRTADRLNDVRMALVRAVNTEFFFYLDDDDALPHDILSILEEASIQGTAVVYTDELWIKPDGSQEILKRQPYSQLYHLTHPQALHHLLIFNTQIAKQMLHEVPYGAFGPEITLSYLMAEKGGATYLPRVGYIWRQGNGGLSHQGWVIESIVRSANWCAKRYFKAKNGS